MRLDSDPRRGCWTNSSRCDDLTVCWAWRVERDRTRCRGCYEAGTTGEGYSDSTTTTRTRDALGEPGILCRALEAQSTRCRACPTLTTTYNKKLNLKRNRICNDISAYIERKVVVGL